MKNSTIWLALILFGSMFADELKLAPFNISEYRVLPVNLVDMSSEPTWTFIPYGQVMIGAPGGTTGGGLLCRTQQRYFGLQADGSVLFLPEFLNVAVAISPVWYPLAKGEGHWNYGGWNFTAGVGGMMNPRMVKTLSPYFPIFTGYQGDQIFLEAGYYVLPVFREVRSGGYITTLSLLVLKTGVCF